MDDGQRLEGSWRRSDGQVIEVHCRYISRGKTSGLDCWNMTWLVE